MSESTAPAHGVRVTHEISTNDSAHAMAHVAEPIIEILNNYSERHNHTVALYGGLYALGCALASIGANLGPGVDLRQQLAPLLDGYDAMLQSKAH